MVWEMRSSIQRHSFISMVIHVFIGCYHKILIFLNSTDSNGDQFLDLYEVEALFMNEVYKFYSKSKMVFLFGKTNINDFTLS